MTSEKLEQCIELKNILWKLKESLRRLEKLKDSSPSISDEGQNEVDVPFVLRKEILDIIQNYYQEKFERTQKQFDEL